MMDYIFFFFPTSLERVLVGTLKKESSGKIRPLHESLKMHFFQNVITDHQQL